MTRKEIVRAIQRLAFAAELKGDNRARAWSNAAWALRSVDEDLAVMIQERRLARVRGIGPSTSALVADLLDGIEPKVFQEIEEGLPEGLFELESLGSHSQAETVLERTRIRALDQGHTVCLLPEAGDVDLPSDLEALLRRGPSELKRAPHTARMLDRIRP